MARYYPSTSELKGSSVSPVFKTFGKRSFDDLMKNDMKYVFRNSHLSYKALGRMYEYFQSEFLCDVELIAAGGRTISAHRLVLSASSEYFAGIFKENCNGSWKNLLHMEDIHAESLKCMISYCYTGEVEIRKDNVEFILTTANFLLIYDVVESCFDFLHTTMDTSNCLSIVSLAKTHNFESLKGDAMEFIGKNIIKLLTSEEFTALKNDDLAELLLSEKLVVPNEDFIYELVKKWLLFNYAERQTHLKQMLELLNLPLISPACLFDILHVFPDAAKSSQNFLDVLRDRLLNQNTHMFNFKLTPRTYIQERILALGGIDGITAGKIEMYDSLTDNWSETINVSDSIGNKWGFSALGVSCNNKCNQILVVGGAIGGNENTKATKSVELIDLKTATIKKVAPLTTARYFLGTAVTSRNDSTFVYAIGGAINPICTTDKVEKLNVNANTWCDIASMKFARAYFGIAMLNNKLYVAGGFVRIDTIFRPTDKVEVLCLDSETWELCSPLTTARGNTTLVSAGKFLYAIGGRSNINVNLSSVERYDPDTNFWCLFTDMPGPRRGMSACISNDKIIICGGRDDSGYPISEVYQFDLISNSWQRLASLTHRRMCASIIHLPYF